MLLRAQSDWLRERSAFSTGKTVRDHGPVRPNFPHPVGPVGNNYPRVVEALVAEIGFGIGDRALGARFVEVRFTGRGAHGSLDLVEIYEMSLWTYV